MYLKNTAAIILAAGKGTRIKAKKINKVMFELDDKPMVAYAVEKLKKISLGQIILVIGFAKDSIVNYFNSEVDYAVQKKRLGTGHAVKAALPELKKGIKYILVLYGDDSAFYPIKVFRKLIKVCQENNLVLSFLTLEKKNPFGLGRIIRDGRGKILKIVEEKNANPAEKKIKEINMGCYCFKRNFLEKFIGKIQKDKIKDEYYLTDIVKIALEVGLSLRAVKIKNEDFWHGVNTKKQLTEAKTKMLRLHEKK